MNEDSKSSQSNVIECSASYYNPATKKWDSGTFVLNKGHIQFINNENINNQFHLCLPLSTITNLEKRQSNLIYPSLVISVGAEKHWFSSLINRDAVYNLVELFWRASLISAPYKKPNSLKINDSNSSLGKELLSILHESENTLIETANTLSDQNHQLSDAEDAVEGINTDLTTAEEAIKSLSSPVLLTSFKAKIEEDLVLIHKYKVTFSFSNDENNVDWEKGTLKISDVDMLLDVGGKLQLQITKDELDMFQVLSPWEFCIVHTFADIQKTCYFMCPQLLRILRFLSSIPHYKEKINYGDDDSSVYETASCSSTSSFNSSLNSPSSPTACSGSSKDFNSDFSQVQENRGTLTDEEIQEINTILQNLQNLAAEVSREQENQMQRIDSLITNMENTELRMKETGNKAKKTS